jgi:hypothetical protein
MYQKQKELAMDIQNLEIPCVVESNIVIISLLAR